MTMQKQPETKTEVAVLNWQVYQQLEKQVTRPVVTTQTTPEQVAFALGVQSVLEVLRNGFVITR